MKVENCYSLAHGRFRPDRQSDSPCPYMGGGMSTLDHTIRPMASDKTEKTLNRRRPRK
jgi:hypothetical protein